MTGAVKTGAAAALPRDVADKSDRKHLLQAIRMALDTQSAAVRHNTQTFNRGRYRATSEIPDYDRLKDEARRIKEESIENLPDLLHTLQKVIEGRGGHVFVAATAEDARRYVLDVCGRNGARLAVKGKSITSEEIHLNGALESAGIEVVETDLAEFILQAADEQPSHIIAPAVHYSRERISALFQRKFNTERALDTGEDLTEFARERLREKFFRADVGITGANLVAAETGTLMLVESEGNIRMASFLPPVHIAIAGVEKVIGSRQKMAVFLELLAASGTGQNLSSYTSFLSPPLSDAVVVAPGKPRRAREFHLVLIDNGRMRMRDDGVFRETLYCIRCSACLNSCANFQTVGGHAFGGETYSGGIGGSWEAGTRGLAQARFSELCTGCSRCVNQCPVRIDIPWLNENLGERLNRSSEGSAASRFLAATVAAAREDRTASASKIFFGNYDYLAKWGTRVAFAANWMGRNRVARAAMERLVGLDRRRVLPAFPAETLEDAERRLKGRVARTGQTEGANSSKRRGLGADARVVVFADAFTNYGLVGRGIATLNVLRGLGVEVVVSRCVAEGRAASSQGMIATAKLHARRAAEVLEPYVKDGRAVIVVEPSSLAMFRRDFRQLLGEDAERFEELRSRSFDPVEYSAKVLEEAGVDPKRIFDVSRSPVGTRLFFHSHCQQRTIGCAAPTEALLRAVGFDVVTSSVECCGMAGSFGYKKDFYELSMAVGADLFSQVASAEEGSGKCALVASGTSCTEQLHGGLGREVLHPMELLERIMSSAEKDLGG